MKFNLRRKTSNSYDKFESSTEIVTPKKSSRLERLVPQFLKKSLIAISRFKIVRAIKGFFSAKDIVSKIAITLLIVVIYRALSTIPLPGIDLVALNGLTQQSVNGGNYLFSLFTGGQFDSPSVIGLGLAAYINASIIMQLLPYAIPRLKELQKEGERGRQIINQITRFITFPLSIFYSIAYLSYLSQRDVLNPNMDPTILADSTHTPLYLISHASGSDWPTAQKILFMAIVLTAGTIFLMWLSELITEKGLGNGSSVIITVGILAQLPILLSQDISQIDIASTLTQLLQGNFLALNNPLTLAIIGVLVGFIIVIASIVFINESQRKVDIQYARRVRGAEVGQGSFLPIKFTITGVLPVIFATSLLSIPQILVPLIKNSALGTRVTVQNIISSIESGFLYSKLDNSIDSKDLVYIIVYFSLVVIFGLFYSFIVLNPKETAENLQKSGAFVPGIRPGRSTEKYISDVLLRIGFVGSVILGIIALIPILSGDVVMLTSGRRLAILSGIGGTSVLIIVGVLLDTMRQYNSLKATRSYDRYA